MVIPLLANQDLTPMLLGCVILDNNIHTYNSHQKSLGYLQKIAKNIVLSEFKPLHRARNSFPL